MKRKSLVSKATSMLISTAITGFIDLPPLFVPLTMLDQHDQIEKVESR